MARRSSSLNNVSVAVSREIGSKYDNVKLVADNIAAVMAVSQEDLPALIAALEEATDFTGITVVSGTSAGWNSTTKVLTVPTVKGDKGDSGVDGSVGATGDKGAQGLRGATGPQGVQGIQGIKGNTGAVGPTGAKGDTGDQGTKGLQGVVGPTGTSGSDGEDGLPGLPGASVHHLKGTSTTDMEGDFGTYGELDTYTFYGDANETIDLGSYVVRNGFTVADGESLGIMYRKTFDTDDSGIVDDSERLGGKPLAQVESERDSAIQAATLAFSSNFTVADIAERDALIDINVGDKVYVTDNGDAKWAYYLVASEAPIVFEVIMEEGTYLNTSTAESIKTSYESNLDTNAYTDSEVALVANAIQNIERGVANGVATLDAGALIPTSQLPAYVDDVLEFTNLAGFPATGETGKIYIAIDTNKTYRWSGTVYVYITSGAVDSVAGKTGIVVLDTSNVTENATRLYYTEARVSANTSVAANTAKVTNVTTDLATVTAATTLTVTSSDGTDALLPAATSTVAGVQTGADKAKLDGIEALADVTDTVNVTSAGALMASEVDLDIKTLVLPAGTTISPYAKTLLDDLDADAARLTLNAEALGDAVAMSIALG